MDIRQALLNVLRTLDKVQVTGRQNMDKMLASMMTIEQVVAEMDKAKKEGDEK